VKNIRKAVAAALITMFAVGAVGCNMITKTEAGVKKSPVAKFDNTTITRGQLDERMVGVQQSFKAQFGDNYMSNADAKEEYKNQQKQMLDNLITEKILLQKAETLKLVPANEAGKTELMNKKMDELKQMYTEDIVKQSGFSGGYEDPKFKEYARDLSIMDKVYENIIKDAAVTDQQAQDYYNANQLQFTEKPNMIKLAHILVATEDEAKKVKERLDKGEDFAKLAKELSTDTGSKDNGGEYEVPYVGSGFDQTFMTAAMAQAEGKISAPIQTQFGYHIIKTIKKTEYPVKKFETVKEEIKASLLSQNQQSKYLETMNKWREEAKIKYYDKNL
jgi:foldase protein PrsA